MSHELRPVDAGFHDHQSALGVSSRTRLKQHIEQQRAPSELLATSRSARHSTDPLARCRGAAHGLPQHLTIDFDDPADSRLIELQWMSLTARLGSDHWPDPV